MNEHFRGESLLSRWRLPIIYLAICAIITLVFIIGINYVSRDNLARQQKNLEQTVHNDIIQCYAIEGIYPPDLDYIVNHYGLIYDNSCFYIDYRPIGSNIFPDYTIIYAGTTR